MPAARGAALELLSQTQGQSLLLDEMLMQAIDRIYMEEPTYGSRRIQDELHKLGHKVGRKRERRLVRVMSIEPIYPKPRLSIPGKGHKKYPCLLRKLHIELSHQVWCTDITYIPLGDSHVYLTAVMDWSFHHWSQRRSPPCDLQLKKEP